MSVALVPPTAPAEAAAQPDALRRRRVAVLGAALSVALGVGAVASVAWGAVAVPPGAVLGALAARLGASLPGEAFAFTSQQEAVVWAIRLPRLALAVVVGAALAASGAVLQGLFRNPLADPGLVGVSAGAALGAALAIVLGAGAAAGAVLGPAAVAAGAFAGGLVAVAVVAAMAARPGRTDVATLLLAGIAVNALCGAAVGGLVLVADDGQLRALTFWTLGSLGGASWDGLAVVAPLVALALAALPRLARALDALLLGEAEAHHVGVRVERAKGLAVLAATLAAAAATATAGLVGFVGLVAPHLVRLAVGPGHRALLPLSALAGATLLVLADLAGRTLAAPLEIPIGVVTALVGAPFFLFLLRTRASALG
ncbi:MAG: FecCD family ABC transporter permease [Rubricoccaceae bacterium]